MSDTPPFLASLLDAVGPSGFEVGAARVWRAEAESFADDVRTDVSGNTLATVNADGRPRVMLAGHIDEIGLQVTHIDEDGFLYIDRIGGWDPQVLVGQRVRILGSSGDVRGVVGKKAILGTVSKTTDDTMIKEVQEFFKKNPTPGTKNTLRQEIERVKIYSKFLKRIKNEFS